MTALMPAHCAPAIKDMIVVLVYGAENLSDILLCKLLRIDHDQSHQKCCYNAC
jgi:hypothetical protein